MKLFSQKIILLFILMLALAASEKPELFIKYSNPQIAYEGRIDSTNQKSVQLFWSGTSIKLNFEGTSIGAIFKDEKGDNYYNVIIDDEKPIIFRPDSIKKFHLLASNLSKGTHRIEIFKRTEYTRGTTSFYGFQIQGNAKIIAASPKRKRKIEFYGNSITSGYAVEDFSGKDSPDSTYTNNYLSYAAITARHFDAEYHCISRSGIGLTISWFPIIMPELYDRLHPNDPKSKWNFSLYQPDIVVINLFQNDSWLVNMKNHEQYKLNFKDKIPNEEFMINAYQQFVSKIRNHYPDAKIICMLGNMDATKNNSIWMDYIKKAASNLNDQKVYTFFMPFKETEGHPSIQEQQKMANSLIQFIDENVEW
ncbi:MAG: GDSL-type esterase/lipase family protein [Polaribacter sp.]|nr:GDSL-type esterase/lipase family protein [Polaribacter sp.]